MRESKIVLKVLKNVACSKRRVPVRIIAINTMLISPQFSISTTSNLYGGRIHVVRKSVLVVFLKVGAMAQKLRIDGFDHIYKTERFFYNTIKLVYERLEKEHMIYPQYRFITPKCHTVTLEDRKNIFVLEHLAAAGYRVTDRLQPMSWKYAKVGLQNLAKFHALSIAWSVEDKTAFNRSADVLNIKINNERFKEYVEEVVKNALEICTAQNKDKLLKFIGNMKLDEAIKKYQAPIRRPVIAFGDYGLSNQLQKKNKNGVLKIISVDYQTLRIGNPIADVLYFICSGSDKEFRKKYFMQSFEHYYSCLCDALKRLDVGRNQVYSRSDFNMEMKEVLPFGVIQSMFSLHPVTVKSKEALSVDRFKELKDLAMPPNELYVERLNGIIEDFIDMELI